MSEVDTLVEAHTREELDQIATDAGVDGAASLPNKEAVAEAIVAAGGAPDAGEAPAEPSEAQGALPEGWTIVNEAEGNYTAEKTVESLGLQKVSEGGATVEQLVAACQAYDDHLARVAEGEIPTTSGAEGATAPAEEVPA